MVYGKQKCGFYMSEPKGNKNLVWINTPFSLTKLDKQYTLLQQNILMVASTHLQKYVEEYFTEKRVLGDARSDYLFEKGIEHAVMEIPPIKIDIKDFQVSTEFHNYKNLRDTLKNDILNLSVRVKTDSKTEKIQHVFSNIEIPTTQKGYTKSDGEKVERIKGEVILEIDPKLTMSLFDMRQGYIHHISMIAKYSKKVNTPRLYIYLLRQMGLDKSLDVKVEFLPMKQYLGLVELDEHGNILLDDKGEPVMNKYPKFSQFRKQVLDVVREDLNRMASRSETDIVFDEFSEEDFIYRNGKHKGDPEYVIFHIKRTDVGINHIGDKDADIARRLNEKINRNRGKKTSDDATQQGDLFAHVYQNPDKKIEVDTTQGFEQWNQFISMVQDTCQQALLGRCKFIGIKNDRFCIAASEDDFAALKTSGLERLAQEFFDCVGSFMPVFYRG